eukprot:TRINITY_DN22433_c0_g1_i1.p1 TRINITY_DN22433_c0_g1~~TRINITY_DN22433_c0_g1_i1.p1  ORF type:complete len:189 (-),score=18.54 TRINITY_DN22433_c0_g1_i1:136-702(-)
MDCRECVQQGDLEQLKSVHEECEGNEDYGEVLMHHEALCCAVRAGRLDMVRYLHGHGVPYDDYLSGELFEIALGGAEMDIAEFLHETACPRKDRLTCDWEYFTDVRVVQWMDEKGWLDPRAVVYAAEAGSEESVEYLHRQGYPLDADAFSRASSKGYLGICRFLVDQGCDYHPEYYESYGEGFGYDWL